MFYDRKIIFWQAISLPESNISAEKSAVNRKYLKSNKWYMTHAWEVGDFKE
jgi:hypothetical protein